MEFKVTESQGSIPKTLNDNFTFIHILRVP